MSHVGTVSKVRLSAPVTVTWEVTAACNLRCRHCLSSSGTRGVGELSTSDALRLVRMDHLLLDGGRIYGLEAAVG